MFTIIACHENRFQELRLFSEAAAQEAFFAFTHTPSVVTAVVYGPGGEFVNGYAAPKHFASSFADGRAEP